jgi:hypothetical protein
MRVPPAMYDRYLSRLERRMPKRGDVSVRTGLTIHRGTENISEHPRPVMILGVMGAGYETFAHHEFTMTRDYFDHLPESLQGASPPVHGGRPVGSHRAGLRPRLPPGRGLRSSLRFPVPLPG